MNAHPSDRTVSLAKTGIAGLDEILGGGLPVGHFYLIEGHPGAGKTTLALQFLLEGLNKGESGLYVTLSESKDELIEVARSHHWQIDNLSLFELVTPEEAVLTDGQYTFFHPAEVELGQTTKSLLEEVERVQPMRIVFDSLSEMRLLSRDPLRYRRQVLGLKQFFTTRGSTVLVLDDLTSNQSDLQPQSIAHGVICLEQMTPEYGAERRRCRISKLRGVKFRGGYHDFTIETGGIKAYPRLRASAHLEPFPSGNILSGSKELDALVGGGIPRGSSTLILGPAGSGKSTLAESFAIAAARRGEKAMIFIFDENERSYIERSEGMGFKVRELVEKGLLELQQVDLAELAPGKFAHNVRLAVEEFGAKVIVIDSLSGYMHAMPAEKFLILHLHELLSYLNQKGVATFITLVQHGLIGDGLDAGALDVSYIADSAILLRYFEAEGEVRKAISVLKKRSGSHEHTIREMTLTKNGLDLGEPLMNFNGILGGSPQYLGDIETLMKGKDENLRI